MSRPKRLWGLLALALIAALLPATGSQALAQGADSANDRPKPERGFERLEGSLADIARAAQAQEGPIGQRRGVEFIDVEVIPTETPGAARAALQAFGAQDTAVIGDLVVASLPVNALGFMNAEPSIGFVQPATTPIPDAVVGQGIAFTGADDWQADGATGAGAEVAIIDGGFAGYAGLLGDDLPASPTIKNYCNAGFTADGAHGTAVAEIVHDIAPGADLHLICIDNLSDLSAAVDYAVDEGVDVIAHSMGWFNSGRGDGSGSLAPIVSAARDGGILWVNSAGNYGEEHWAGTFTDGDDDGFTEFGGTDETIDVELAAGESLTIFMRWDSWPVTSLDYDLLLYDAGMTLIDGSYNIQSGFQPPTEALGYTNVTGSTTTVHVVIEKYDGPEVTPQIDLLLLGGSMQAAYSVPAGSLVEPASSPLVSAVGAVYVENGLIEDYSSRGPTIDGTLKPDVAAPDGVTSAAYGGFRFFGTSAAAPHAAGIAALIAERRPDASPAELATLLAGGATDLGVAGPDNVFGYGSLVDVPVLEEEAPVTDILDNGFESGSVGASPHGFESDGGGTWSILGAAARSDSFGARFESSGQTGTVELEINGPRGDGSSHIAVEPGQAVGFSMWARSDTNGAVNRVRPRINFYSAGGSYLDGVSHLAIEPDTTWRETSIAGIAPANTAFATFEIRVHDDDEGGTFDFDDLELIGPATPTETVTDGGFESGTLDAHHVTPGGGSWDVASDVSHTDSHAARFDATSQSSVATMWVNGDRGDAATHIPVTEGELVGFQAWVRSDGATNPMRPRLQFYDSSGVWLAGVSPGRVVPTTAWKRVEVAAVVPPDAAYSIFQVRVHATAPGGTYYVDDVELIGVDPPLGGVLDAGFESGTFDDHHTTSGGGSWSVSSAAARTGDEGAAFDPTAQTDLSILWANGNRHDADHVEVTEGDLVGFSVWVRADTAGSINRVRPRIHFYDGDGTYLIGVSTSVTRPTTTWTRVDIAGVAPTGASYAIFQLRIHDDGHANTIYVDDLWPTLD